MLTINSDYPLRDTGISNSLGIEKLPRHRWYFLKEGFSPRLVQEAIDGEELRPGEHLVDPFAGGGTVPLAGVTAGLRTSAFEVNPFLRFLSQVKLLDGSAAALEKAARVIVRAIDRPVRSPLEGYSTFGRNERWKRWLFPTDVLRGFEAGRRALSTVPECARPFLKLALIGAAMDCCNATRDGKCLRYPKGWMDCEATIGKLQDRFQTRVDAIVEDLASAPLRAKRAGVTEGDARKLIPRMKVRFRLCVTSPPYLNSFDYSDVYRPELFLGAFVKSNQALMRVRLRTIRSHVQASWPLPTRNEFGSSYQCCIGRIRENKDTLWDPRLPAMVQAYFEDMESVLKSLRQRARDDASLWLVVSTSAYGGVEVPVDLILAEIGQKKGWRLREIGVLRYLRSSSQHVQHVDDEEKKSVPLRESVVIFDACACPSVYA